MKKIKVVAAVIRAENKFFIAKRGYGEFKGFWEFPGGKVEALESDEEALKREIREELEIEVEVCEMLCKIEHNYENFSVDLSVYMARILKGNIILKEHMDSSWITIDEIDKFEFLAGNVKVIEELKSKFIV
ncbi:(deoxy)nucleoside triphosphate pyrophosphohydrolase [Peptoniphilus indolicus]|uniref:8-oxo-dGTP diphosphatase n=2 Tax=Peptoniphilus indolicus TaxID=33030 RepID=G4D3G4_9FIRM|nr:NUDIX domain-containing protein [Peptoniphilus indolicus]EGY79930.1 mutator MutT protein [Peptoniphilus indolicus ATCC 29427]SUB75633.1 CTP pyrophosphohydrolase [Peptoniphilus indolicus]